MGEPIAGDRCREDRLCLHNVRLRAVFDRDHCRTVVRNRPSTAAEIAPKEAALIFFLSLSNGRSVGGRAVRANAGGVHREAKGALGSARGSRAPVGGPPTGQLSAVPLLL